MIFVDDRIDSLVLFVLLGRIQLAENNRDRFVRIFFVEIGSGCVDVLEDVLAQAHRALDFLSWKQPLHIPDLVVSSGIVNENFNGLFRHLQRNPEVRF